MVPQRWVIFGLLCAIHVWEETILQWGLTIDAKIIKIFTLYLLLLTFLKDHGDMSRLKQQIKEMNKSWQSDKVRNSFNSDNKVKNVNEKQKQQLLSQFGIDEDLLLESSSEYLYYSTKDQSQLKQLKYKWKKMKNNHPELYDNSEDDEVEGDFTFYRFLKARKWDVDKALTMYEKYRAFRKAENVPQYTQNAVGPFGSKALLKACEESFESVNGLETNPALRLVSKDPCEKYFRTFCSAVNCGYTKCGSPIYIERTGEISPIYSKMMAYIDSDEVVRRHIRQQELVNQRCREISEAVGVPVGKQTLIFDLKGMSFYPNAAAMDVFKRVLKIDASFYPETLHTHFLINAPGIFLVVWKLVSTWLDPVTKTKFHILGSNYQDTLLKHIDKSQLPIEYGGTNKYNLPHVTLRMDVGEQYAAVLHKELDKSVYGRIKGITL